MEGSNLENTFILKVVKLPFLTPLFHIHKSVLRLEIDKVLFVCEIEAFL